MILGIGTAHRACSLALVEGSEVIASTHEIIGRGHAERLMPMLADLLDGRRPDEIVVEVGPGSFTGIRIGVAAARALALAWKVPIHGISSMVLTAARAFAEGAEPPLAVVLDGGRAEVFTQSFDSGPAERSEVSAVPAEKFDFAGISSVAGTGLPLIKLPAGISPGPDGAPNISDIALLKPLARFRMAARPVYVRAPDAKLPGTPC